MKKLLMLSGLACFLLSAPVFAGQLDGKTFCRESGSALGAPPDTKHFHCVSFANDLMEDNANTAFGNPPAPAFRYNVDGVRILNEETGEATEYEVEGEQSIVMLSSDMEGKVRRVPMALRPSK